MSLTPQQKPAPAQDDGWETITNPADVPNDIRKSLGVAGVRQALGLTSGSGGSGKAVPQWAKKDFEKPLDKFSRLDRALSSFDDNYGGNLLGGIENTIQGIASWTGTKGQRNWWADFQETDNQIRNELFGATLTPSEQRAYLATTISPDLDPKIIRDNLQKRRDIVREATKRQYKFLQAQGYNQESIQALAGSYVPEFDDAVRAERDAAQAQMEGGDQTSEAREDVAAVTENSTPPPPSGPAPDEIGVFGDDERAQTSATKQKDQEFVAALQAKFDAGGSLDDLNALAKQYGFGNYASSPEAQEAVKKAIADRDRGVTGLRFGPVQRDAPDISADRGNSDLGDNIKAFARGIPAVVGLDDEVTAAADVILNGKDWGDALEYNRAIRDFDEQENFWARLGGQLTAGVLIPSGIPNAGRTAALTAARGGAGRAASLAAGARGAAVRGAQEGAALGGAYGFGEADGDLGTRAINGILSSIVGAGAGGVTGFAGNRLATRNSGAQARSGAGPLTEGQEVLAAADRQGVTPFAADVGGPATRMATAGAAQTLGGVGPIRRAAQATLDTAEAARDRVAASFGIAANPEQAGEAARLGARSFIARTSARGNALYSAAESAAGQAIVEAPNAVQFIEREIQPLIESGITTGATGVLTGLRDIIAQPRTVRGIRALRTQIRDQFEEMGLRGSNAQRIANRTMDILTDDVADGLRAQGLDQAARAYQVADRYWRNRLATIDDALEPIIGGQNSQKSAEQIVKGLKASMSGNNRRFSSFMNSLPAQEQGTVRASLITGLGRATKGNQDETGEVFSLPTFLTHWNEIGESAKRTLFGDEGRAALNDLAIVARGSKQAQRFANHSNSAGSIGFQAGLGGASSLAGIPGIVFAAKLLASSYAAGRLLASPRFARWIARMPHNPRPVQARGYIGRLTRVANAEPAIANEVLDLQRRLVEAFAQTPTRAAAAEKEQQ